jgi:NAD(P)-dependent dehydrogenase (short-subunit alcohol dehydrogenase family)
MMKRVAVVTGASRGIGHAVADQLAERGLRVIATTRETLDVSSDKSVDAFARHLEETEKHLDVLVNNAGVSLEGFDAEIARRTIEVNFKGAVRTTERLLPLFRQNGRIVMVSSGMGELSCLGKDLRDRFGDPTLRRGELMKLVDRFVADVAAGKHEKNGWPTNAYRVSKVAMNAYVRILARELTDDPRRIKVNAACPGWVRTRMGGPGAPRSVEDGAKTPVWLALAPEDGPMGGFFRDESAVPW